MKRIAIVIFCILLATAAGCGPKKYVMKAQILETGDGYILVEPDPEASERSSSDRIVVRTANVKIQAADKTQITPEQLQTGQRVLVTYDGVILESYPAQLGKCFNIRVVE